MIRLNRFAGWSFAWVIAVMLVLAALLGYVSGRRLFQIDNSTRVTHSLVLDRVQDVAKLVSTEYHLRDVVLYENTWYGSKKKSLVVATGKILAGIDLGSTPDVTISRSLRRIEIRLPCASVLATDITELKTYDETRGWWNPFTLADRDEIYRMARTKLLESAGQLQVRDRAQRSAKRLLEAMFSRDGFTAEVSFR